MSKEAHFLRQDIVTGSWQRCWTTANQTTNFVSFHDAGPLNVITVGMTVDGIAATTAPCDIYRFVNQLCQINTVNPSYYTISGSYDLTITFTSGCGSGWTDLLTDLEDAFLSPFEDGR